MALNKGREGEHAAARLEAGSVAGLCKEGPGNLGSGSWQIRVQGTRVQEFGVQGPVSSGCRCVPAGSPSALLAGRISQGIPAQHCRERAFWSRMSTGKRRVGSTCHAGDEGVGVMVVGELVQSWWPRHPYFQHLPLEGVFGLLSCPIRHSAALAM